MAKRKLRGIYTIRNEVSGRVYVGSATDVKARWRAHRYLLRRGKHHSPTLQRSWDKHGSDEFVFEVLEVCDLATELNSREQYWIDMLQAAHPDSGFNVGAVAGSRLGVSQPAGHSTASSIRFKGKPKSPEHRAAISAAMKGRAKSAEHREKLAASVAKTMNDPERRAASALGGKMSGGWNKGAVTPEATRARQSVSAKARMSRKARGEDGRFLV